MMFFPATHGDKIEIDPEHENFHSISSMTNTKKYLEKPTIIMCNPNALIYQWMVTSSNAYWLDFFLFVFASCLISGSYSKKVITSSLQSFSSINCSIFLLMHGILATSKMVGRLSLSLFKIILTLFALCLLLVA